MKKLLITGASGFIGGFIVEKALEKGFGVFAVVRKTSSKKYLSDTRINFVELSLNDVESMTKELESLKTEHGQFDFVIHNAGITKTNHNTEYFVVNTEITKKFIQSLMKAGLISNKFIFISSLAAAGPGTEESNNTIKIDQTPRPVTSYGKSKLEAEKFLQETSRFPYLILRPTAVFGPRDAELFTLFSIVSKGFEFYIGTDKQRLSFIYVKDFVDLLFGALESEVTNKIYYLSDGKNYLIKDFAQAIKSSMTKKTLKIIVPVPIVSAIAFILEKLLGAFGKVPALNSEKMAELTSANWTCDMIPFFNDVSARPKYDLQSAIDETVTWYKQENWI